MPAFLADCFHQDEGGSSLAEYDRCQACEREGPCRSSTRESANGHENSEGKTAAEVLRLQEQLAEANVMVDAHKETIAELCEDNKRLRSQHGDMERIVPAYENLQRENEDLRDS